jgi:excisionase family DNA binding protein
MYEDWPTIQETITRTGISERTLFRRIKEGSLRKAEKKIPGRKPLVVLHPEDVERLEAETLKPIPVSIEGKLVPAKPDTATSLADILTTASTRIKLTEKFFLSVEEAAQLSGLTKAHVLRAVREGKLPAIKDAGYRILREELQRYSAAIGGMATLLNKSLELKEKSSQPANDSVAA